MVETNHLSSRPPATGDGASAVRLVLVSAALALIALLTALPMWVPPRATVRLVVGFTRLAEPILAQEVEARATAAIQFSARTPGLGSDVFLDAGLAAALLDELVRLGIVAADISQPIADALGQRDAPRDATVLYLADLANGSEPLSSLNPGANNNLVHAIYGAWVPRVRHDRLDDGAVRLMIMLTIKRGSDGLRAASRHTS